MSENENNDDFEYTEDEPQPRRFRRVPVGWHMLGHMLGLLHTHPQTRFVADMPEGARLVSWHTDFASDSLMLVFEHESWDDVPLGQVIPLHRPMTRVIDRAEDQR